MNTFEQNPVNGRLDLLQNNLNVSIENKENFLKKVGKADLYRNNADMFRNILTKSC